MTLLVFSPRACLALLFSMISAAAVVSSCSTIPSQLHLSMGGDDKIVVSWSVLMNSRCASAYLPFVSYAPLEDSTSFISKDCRVHSNFKNEYYVDCQLPSLKHDTAYRYVAGDVGSGLSSPRVFHTTPIPGSSTRISIFGDLGVDNVEGTIATLTEAINTRYTDLLLHAGDISYADNERIVGPNEHYDDITNEFFDLIEPIASRAPYLVTPGNHDATCHILGDEGCAMYQRNFTVFNTRFNMPSIASGAEGAQNMWYSVNYGDVHLISINTETDHEGSPYISEPGRSTTAGGFGDQLAWLEADLAAASAPEALAVRPWIVVIGHRPLYSSSTTDYPAGQEARTRKAFEPLLQKYNVPLYISGHVHLYERTWPMKDGKVTREEYGDVAPGEVVYVINGAAGNEEGHPEHITPELPEYTAVRNNALFGVGFLSTHKENPNMTPGTTPIIAKNGDFKLMGAHPRNEDRMGEQRTLVPSITEEIKLAQAARVAKMEEQERGADENKIYLCYAFVAAGNSPTQPEDRICLSKPNLLA